MEFYNRLATATKSNDKKVEFVYDGFGCRKTKIVSTWSGSGWTPISLKKFVYDGWNMIAELDVLDNILNYYTWGVVGVEQLED